MRTLLCLAVTLSITVFACASTYHWLDIKRPPVSITQAISKAEAELGVESDRYYCVSAVIAGAKDPDDAEWKMRFCAEDGSSKCFLISMTGEVSVLAGNPPIRDVRHEDIPRDLDDAQNRIAELLRSSEFAIDATERQDTSVTVSRSAHVFKVHEWIENRHFAIETTDFIGPSERGYWIRLTVHDELPKEMRRWDPHYWFATESRHNLANGKYLVYEGRYGWDFPYALRGEIGDVLGEPIVDPW